MLYYLLVPLREYFIFFNVFRYITVRTTLAGIAAFLICLIFGPWVIKMLNKYQKPRRPNNTIVLIANLT